MRSFPPLSALIACSLLALTTCSSESTAPSGSTVIASIQNFYFYPYRIAVRVGASVEWTNYDPVSHTTTSDVGLWDSGSISPAARGGGAGGSFRFTFTQPGTYRYHCSIHPPNLYPGFVGIVVVRP